MAKVVWREKALLLLEAHYYDKDSDTVYIDYIWDMRMNPVKLEKMAFD